MIKPEALKSQYASEILSAKKHVYDLIIVGGGPAGLSAALYAAREKADVLLIECGFYGGQIALTSEVENYPGIVKTSGPELSETMRSQAERFGCKFLVAEVESLDFPQDEPIQKVTTDDGDYYALKVLVCSGAYPRLAGFEGEETFRGRGVSYCATCDGMFYTGKTVYVVGGGYAACEEAVYLTKHAAKVIMIIRRNVFSAPETITQAVVEHPQIEVRFNTKIKEISGKFVPERIVFEDTATGEITEQTEEPGSFGVFVFTGYIPETKLVQLFVDTDEQGGVVTDKNMRTKTQALYCAGDIRGKHLRQLVTAASDGALAAVAAGKENSELKFFNKEFSEALAYVNEQSEEQLD